MASLRGTHHTLAWILVALWFTLGSTPAAAASRTGEELYTLLSSMAAAPGEALAELNERVSRLPWGEGEGATRVFQGNLRRIQSDEGASVYLVRSVKGELFLLALPEDAAFLEKGADSPYAGLDGMLSAKMAYEVRTLETEVDGVPCLAARLTSPPRVSPLDRIFRIAIVVVLFAVMLGMGMTLTTQDFLSIFKQPLGIFIGLLCLFGVMPLIAFALGHLLGYVTAFPFIYVGMILITSTPGGATSNLMTHLAKGDVALSISLTAIATFLSLVVTPALLLLYCSNLPQVEMPVKMVMLPIFVLVLLPLGIGMLIKARFESFCEKAVPVFNVIGVVAVLICIVGGIAGNPEMIADSLEKFGLTGLLVVVLLSTTGMVMGAIVPKLFRISNVQTRAISLEVGIRNAILGMTIALLIQDRVGDFNSYMFAVCGLFAIVMYLIGAGALMIHKITLPLDTHPVSGPAEPACGPDEQEMTDTP